MEANALKSASFTINDVTSLCERVVVDGIPAAELPSSPSGALHHISKAIAELRQARDILSTRSKELANIAELRTSFKSLEDYVAFCEISKKD